MNLVPAFIMRLLRYLPPAHRAVICLLLFWGMANAAIFFLVHNYDPKPELAVVSKWSVRTAVDLMLIAYVLVLAPTIIGLFLVSLRRRRTATQDRADMLERTKKVDLKPVAPGAGTELPVPKEIHDAVAAVGLEGPWASSSEPNAPRQQQQGPRLVCVVSGKGGVGKSVVSLGLLERSSCESDTLLVDFDLHNRGLTSLLQGHALNGADEHHSLTLLEEFLDCSDREKPFKEALQRAFDGRHDHAAHGSFDEGQFKEQLIRVVGEFAGRNLFEAGAKRLKAYRFPGDDPDIDYIKKPVRVSRAHFLPSMPIGMNFMTRKRAFESKTSEVFVFLFALLMRAAYCNRYSNIIVDCHGAHDTFTAGAICAATDIVIVTTPDIGSHVGTKQLIEYSLGLRQVYAPRRFRSKLVINRCFEDEPNVNNLAENWGGTLSDGRTSILTDGLLRIDRRETVERLSRTYKFGAVAKDRYLWDKMEEISQMLFTPLPGVALPPVSQPSQPGASPPVAASSGKGPVLLLDTESMGKPGALVQRGGNSSQKKG